MVRCLPTMHLLQTLLLLQFLSSTSLAQTPQQNQNSRLQPRSLDTLVDPEPSSPQPESHILPHSLDLHNLFPDSSFFKKLDLRNAAEIIPFLKDLSKRATTTPDTTAAVAPATNANTNTNTNTNANANAAGAQAQQPAANANANANTNANTQQQVAAGAGTSSQQKAAAGGTTSQQKAAAAGTTANDDEDTPAVAPQQPAPVVAPAIAAPVAGGGGGAGPAPAQPAPGAQANGVSIIQVTTVVAGVTKVVASTFSQKFAGAGAAPAVQTGTIGLGTLTGKIGVVKTDDAKSEALIGREGSGVRWSILGVVGGWVVAMGTGGAIFGLGLI